MGHLKRPSVFQLHQVHSLKQFLVLQPELLNKQFYEANPIQTWMPPHFGPLRFITSPLPKRMVFQQDNSYGGLVIHLGI